MASKSCTCSCRSFSISTTGAVPPLTVPSVYTVLGILFLLLPMALVLWLKSGRAVLGAAWLILFLLPSGSAMLLGPAGRTLYPAVLAL